MVVYFHWGLLNFCHIVNYSVLLTYFRVQMASIAPNTLSYSINDSIDVGRPISRIPDVLQYLKSFKALQKVLSSAVMPLFTSKTSKRFQFQIKMSLSFSMFPHMEIL